MMWKRENEKEKAPNQRWKNGIVHVFKWFLVDPTEKTRALFSKLINERFVVIETEREREHVFCNMQKKSWLKTNKQSQSDERNVR